MNPKKRGSGRRSYTDSCPRRARRNFLGRRPIGYGLRKSSQGLHRQRVASQRQSTRNGQHFLSIGRTCHIIFSSMHEPETKIPTTACASNRAVVWSLLLAIHATPFPTFAHGDQTKAGYIVRDSTGKKGSKVTFRLDLSSLARFQEGG